MIGTAMLPLNLLCVIAVDAARPSDAADDPGPVVVADEDGDAAAFAALRHARAAVWVGPPGTPAYEEFCDEIGHARRAGH